MPKKRFKKIYIEITNVCNLNCSFCVESDRDKKFMSADSFETILKKIKPYTDYVYMHVLGEPLLHQELGLFLDLCEKYSIHANITTNGSLIKKSGDMLMQKSALRQMNFSLHSLTGKETENIEKLMDIISFSKSSAKTMYIVLRLWDIMDSEFSESLDRWIWRTLRQSFSYKDELTPEALKQSGIKLSEHIFLQLNKPFIWPGLGNSEIFTSGRCYGMRDQAAILVDGSVTPCCVDSEGIIQLGNIFETPAEEIFNSDRAEVIREGFRAGRVSESLCRTCGFGARLMVNTIQR